MAKLFTMFLILIAIQGALLMYHSTTPQNTTIWNFIMNTDKWNTQDFMMIFGGIAAMVALIGISAGGTFRFVSDFLTLGVMVTGLISIGVVFTNLANVLRSELVSRFFPSCIGLNGYTVATCTPVNLIVGLAIGPWMLYYAWTVIEWWRGKDY